MIRRPLWLATGVALGVGGTIWTQRRVGQWVSQAQQRWSPDNVVANAARGASQLPARVRAANAAASAERRRQEHLLRARFAPQTPGHTAWPAHARRR